MNREMIFNEFAKYVEADDNYYRFGKHGKIEDMLAWFNIESERFTGPSSVVHCDNLDKLHEFIKAKATDEQLQVILGVCNGDKIPKLKTSCDTFGKVFVSMPMNIEKCDCVEEIREGIKLGVENTGNIVYFLDKDIHSDNIYNMMIEKIHSCKFLVADLTSQNTGVYLEAGYARGLGKNVIFTCKEADFKNVHFDIKQVQIVIWKDKEELRDKLAEQIKGLGLGEH